MSPPTAEQSQYLSTLEDTANMLQKAQSNIKKCPKTRLTEGYLRARLKSVEEYWVTFKEAHNKLTRCTPREQRGVLPYFLNEEFYKFEDLYLCFQGDATDLLLKIEASQKMETPNLSKSSQDGTHSSLAKLPRIQLPTFSGKYEDWPLYQDLFTALVHNTTISEVQKLHYLKTTVSGEAEVLLRNIQITGSNYIQAWELLKERFGNKRMIVNSLLKKLFGQKKVSSQSAAQIKAVLDTTTECITSLNNLKVCTDSWDPLIIFLVGQKLDTESVKDWEESAQKADSDAMPTWDELKKFLRYKFRTLELIAPIATSSPRDKLQTHKSFHISSEEGIEEAREDIFKSAHAAVSSSQTTSPCTYCKERGHYIHGCKAFANQSVEQRRDFAKYNNLCFNCLIPNHSVFKCKHRTNCRVCGRRHHSLLHMVLETKQEGNPQQEPEQTTELETEHKITSAHFSSEQPRHQVLLATAQVNVRTKNGDIHLLRALIDQGSEASFVSARAVELLGLTKTNINGVVSGVGEGTKISIRHLVDLSVTSRFDDTGDIRVKAYVLKTISTKLPSTHIAMKWPMLHTLPLADPTYSTPGKIDMLLGAEVFCKIIEDGLVKIPDGVVAQKTCLGWILSGQREDQSDIKSSQHKVITLHATRLVAEDNDILRRFWEIETELYKKKKLLTKEEEECERIYKQTIKRNDSGRYTVHLPLRQSIEETINLCGETKQQAINRFIQLEKKLQRDQNLKAEYTKVIHEYKEMGHMKKSDTPEDKVAIYLPHHAVVREDKDTTKVRVVFDASAKGSNGNSLNDTMMVGPVLQQDLRSLIMAWRTHKICIVGDIVKMYRMINMTETHTNLQRIIWRDDINDEIEVYNLTTVAFGTAAAPFLSVRTLSQLADDEAINYPEAAPVIKSSFYMDDLMAGNESVEKTKRMCEEIKDILLKGGFKMQKWSSNSEEVLRGLQGEANDTTKDKVDIKLDKIIRILGLTWDRKDDTFNITVNLPEISYPVTKRSILSDVARLFDPFGWLAPVIINAKTLIQRLWLCSLGWDDELPLDWSEEWIKYREELIHLQNIKIPRWLSITPNDNDVQLHGFADASTQAYAAVTYLRVVKNNIVHVTMLASRTKVAPLKQLTIPKLELCAAALLAELINDLEEILNISKDNVFAWTDSMVVLSWLQSQPNRWRTFVANRVADITRVLDNDRWRHVQSADNAADIATRGINASELANLETWWTGPQWLKQESIDFVRCDIPKTELELKGAFHTTLQEEKPIWERFSNLTRMKRVLAYCRRILKKEGSEPRDRYLTSDELERVLEECIKYYQSLVYGKEIEDLKNKGQVKTKSSLITLSPFLDEKGIIRVGGRLQNALIASTAKHPIIIPTKQHITELLINDAHNKTLHGGIQLMMTYVRTRYWVISLKTAVKKCIRNCKTCIVHKAKTRNQFMGQLPAMRVNPHRAFLNSGVDYAGPIMIRTSKGRGHHATKGYVCLFVCMATRAIHLEAVTDLTSHAFIAAFRRFVARRGHCSHLWSDNGTNFIGAAKELRELFHRGTTNLTREVAELLANDGTTAHFIPPRMPSYGGLWEAGIQSAKRHLARVSKDTKLTYEEMATLLTQIEACLNSRPLCQMDNTTEIPLTPGHFLVGEPLIGVPDLNYQNQRINLLTRWQLIQRMTQDFWHRWQTEYLNTLQQRYKWQVTVPPPAVGDIVIVKNADLPPTKWLLGKIKLLHTGADDLVRVVTIQCKGNHELKRPLSKVILLPKDTDK